MYNASMKKILENDLYVLVGGKRGALLANKYDRFIGREIITYGEFGEIQLEMFSQIIRPGHTVLDVGANIGGYTLPFAQAVGPSGTVWAYEPQPVVFQNLCANLALNGLVNTRAFNAGCGADSGQIMVPPIRYDTQGNFGGVSLDMFKEHGEATPIPIYKLDEHFTGRRLDFMKIDVEGMELDVLQGAQELIRKFQPIIYAENDRKEKSEALLQFIFDSGYNAWWHCPPLFNPKNFAGKSENVIGNFVSHNILCLPKNSAVRVENLRPVDGAKDHVK